MLDAMEGADPQTRNRIAVARQALAMLADGLKSKSYEVEIINRVAMLDALCDQVVTSIGVAHCLGMNIDKGLDIVSTSNWSKFTEDGHPIFDVNGKIKKGSRYVPPHLDECV
jgi:predicted HAD superfamily Cof-like phosphohydrolase